MYIKITGFCQYGKSINEKKAFFKDKKASGGCFPAVSGTSNTKKGVCHARIGPWQRRS